MKRIRIGQIGIAHNHGSGKMSAVRKYPELFEVVGYSEEDAEWIAKRGDLECYKDLPVMSEDEIIDRSDAVLIECEVGKLTEKALKCVSAGKHIHLDKPASGTLQDYSRLLDTAKEKNLIVQLGYMYRYNPAVKKCFEFLRDGKLGRILSLNAEMSTYHDVEYKKWLSGFDGGIMYILGSHLVDLAVYALGEPRKVVSFLKHTKTDGIDYADNNLAVLEYGDALARIFVSSVEVNGWGRRQLVVSGDKGTVNIMPLENKTAMTYSDLSIATNAYEDMKATIQIPDIPKNCRYDNMMRDFYDYVTGVKENPFVYDHEYKVQKTLYRIIYGDKKEI